jgi:hypothetical protein
MKDGVITINGASVVNEAQTNEVSETDESPVVYGEHRHTSSEWIVDKTATCTKDGSKYKECINCHTELKREKISAAHHYQNGVCSVCGDVFPDYYTNGLEFELNDKKTEYTVTAYTGVSKTVLIPSLYNDLPVTSIAEGALGRGVFAEKDITTVLIGDNIRSIGAYAFYGCEKLTNVELPTDLKKIGDKAFFGCSRLEEILLPEGVEQIGQQAFCDCGNLDDIDVAEGNEVFASEDGALFDKAIKTLLCCPAGRSGAYSVPKTVEKIGNFAFYRCNKMTSLTFFEGVKKIDSEAIYDCEGLEKIEVDPGNTAFKSVDGVLFDVDGERLICYPAQKEGESYTLPDGVKTIGDVAFYGCGNLRELAVTDGVISIGYRAFGQCKWLETIGLPASLETIGEEAFFGCSSLISVTVPSGVTEIGARAFLQCDKLEDIYVAEGNEYFSDVSGVLLDQAGNTLLCYPSARAGEFVVPDGVTSIGESAFYGCSGVTKITMTTKVTKIGSSAFAHCGNLVIVYGGTDAEWGRVEKGSDWNDQATITVQYSTVQYSSDENETV